MQSERGIIREGTPKEGRIKVRKTWAKHGFTHEHCMQEGRGGERRREPCPPLLQMHSRRVKREFNLPICPSCLTLIYTVARLGQSWGTMGRFIKYHCKNCEEVLQWRVNPRSKEFSRKRGCVKRFSTWVNQKQVINKFLSIYSITRAERRSH